MIHISLLKTQIVVIMGCMDRTIQIPSSILNSQTIPTTAHPIVPSNDDNNLAAAIALLPIWVIFASVNDFLIIVTLTPLQH